MPVSANLSTGLDSLQRLGVTLFVISKINRNNEHSELLGHLHFFFYQDVHLIVNEIFVIKCFIDLVVSGHVINCIRGTELYGRKGMVNAFVVMISFVII